MMYKNITCTILSIFKCAVQWREVYSRCCAAIAAIHLKNSSSGIIGTLCPLNSNSLFYSPPLATTLPLWFSLSCKCNHAAFVLLLLAPFTWQMSTSFISVVARVRISFLETSFSLHNIPLYVYSTLCLFMHVWLDMHVFSILQLTCIMLLWIWAHRYFLEILFSVI